MLYSIIPPILVVLSLVGIIVLLMKKSDLVANLNEEMLAENLAEENKEGRFLANLKSKAGNVKWDDVKHFFLAVLEKITRKSRVLFLKLESKFNGWSNSIRQKRKNRHQATEQVFERKKENDIIKKLKEYKLEKKKNPLRRLADGEEKKEAEEKIAPVVSKILETEEKQIKPIISDKVVTPRMKTEMKDKLEELLIERIAVNPKDIEAYERLGEYYMEIKSFGDSKECFKQVMKLDPANRNAKYRIRRLEILLAK